MSDNDAQPRTLVPTTVRVASAYLSHNHVPAAELPSFIRGVHASLANLQGGKTKEAAAARKATAAEIKRSVTPDHIVSFEDGKRYKTLRRHLTLRGLSPVGYRAKWGLPSDYPIVAASYSAARAELARSIGLGRPNPGSTPNVSPVATRQLETGRVEVDEASAPAASQLDNKQDEAGEEFDSEASEITREPFEDDAALD